MTEPNMPNDMQDLIRQAAEVQAQLQQAQQELLATEVTGTAGGELVKVTMTGGAEITNLEIKKEAVDPEDVESLQDLILAAYRDAHTKAGELAQEKIGPLTGGSGLGQQGGPTGGQSAGDGEIPFGGII
ncbi:YbaB/EbfC family nucleoid-associated protein [Corynebacterium hadale]|uniref:Nucleoid-associated protein CIG21_00915 n=3 Tax=Corynebacterium TaxID=1716 RepID=A0A269PGM6_9CORY|nr:MULTISPECIES: YbaB/EbfC family nucleoid-associated protein [Corynebacterium]MBL7284908.1 YbaB/EbfC family nucleoid-associated protein [Corynebacterium godavarianum]MCG7253937.1 YbaB/EbfC family nucleoid-associated protein [Corynebacterium hadale]MCG7256952.1 YbaB/EbfC family nucleoid-associated protein [Corynebacterium hadale]MCG7265456.1 YbaB/EbfC family nucleoid-associated protein [Corynebacterium hadale]PAJ71323.1 YbaB/EbfC family nucleoid-associated protein [Corynebacterium hadale]